jgi:uncharacterized caspase-like protein
MRSVIRITLITVLLFILSISTVYAATESRTALVIGNSAYSSGPLKNPVNDAADMAAMLKKLGFTVMLKQNAKLQEMDEAIEAFGNSLKRGGVGLFYYAGHGVQVNGTNYLLPVGARINKEADVKYQAVDANRILDEMATANNGLNIVMLDACRDNPYARSFRNATRGLAIVSSAPSGTFISYATSPGNVARDGDGRNSPYTKAVLENIDKPGLTINDVFMNVRTKVKRETGQVPWELSSLEGRFYFTLQGSGQNKLSAISSSEQQPESDEIAQQKVALERERQELAREKQEIERQNALNAEREQLATERRKIEAERQTLATGKSLSPFNADATTKNNENLNKFLGDDFFKKFFGDVHSSSFSNAVVTSRDGRFIAYNNGTVLDTKTNLMWASKDNGSSINWANAKSYCENYRGGGYKDWRMPTQDELAGLYDRGTGYRPDCAPDDATNKVHLTNLITLSCWVGWASERRDSFAAYFNFGDNLRWWYPQSFDAVPRALPVRSGK